MFVEQAGLLQIQMKRKVDKMNVLCKPCKVNSDLLDSECHVPDPHYPNFIFILFPSQQASLPRSQAHLHFSNDIGTHFSINMRLLPIVGIGYLADLIKVDRGWTEGCSTNEPMQQNNN